MADGKDFGIGSPARWLAVLAGAAVLLAGCASGSKEPKGKLKVVVAFYPIEMAARRVGGTLVSVTDLTRPASEPHDLTLRPTDVRAIQSADLILYFNQGFQPAVEDAIETLPDKSKAVDLLSAFPLKQATGDAAEELKVDPHVWLSPPNMQKIVEEVADALAKKLPSHAAEFRDNAKAIGREISALDDLFRDALSTCKRHEIFTSHAAFAYLAERYGLRQIPIEGLTPEAEPSSRRLQEIAEEARRDKATTIFFETLVSPRVSQAVARFVGAKTAVLDPIEGLLPLYAKAGADYFSVMHENLVALVEALDCKR